MFVNDATNIMEYSNLRLKKSLSELRQEQD